MPSISQTDVGENSCGACATSYVLEDLLDLSFTSECVEQLWQQVQFGTAYPQLDIHADSTDPTKLLAWLRRNYHQLTVVGYMARDSVLAASTAVLAYPSVVQEGDPMAYLIGNPTWRVIGIYKTSGLHYVVTKYENDRYLLKDSNGLVPTWVCGPAELVNGKTFSAPLNKGTASYTYLGAGLLVHL